MPKKKNPPASRTAVAPPAPGSVDQTEFLRLATPTSLLFYNVIEPVRPPETSKGGIIMASQTTQAEELNTRVGVVRQKATLSYATQTPGLDYSKEINQPEVGDYVFYTQHAGVPMSFVWDKSRPIEDPANRLDFVLLTDTDILTVLTKWQADHLVGWAQ